MAWGCLTEGQLLTLSSHKIGFPPLMGTFAAEMALSQNGLSQNGYGGR